MTMVEKSHTNDNYYISLEIKMEYGTSFYNVQVCPIISDSICGFPIREMIYSIIEKEKAHRTYERYMKKYI